MTGLSQFSEACRRLPLGLIACAVGLAAGCGGDESARLVDYLDELEFDVPLETAAQVSLGKFDFPVAASVGSAGGSKFVQVVTEGGRTATRLQFELTAETTPLQAKALEEVAAMHRGGLSDAALTVVRTSTVDELNDPRLSSIKGRLSEIARPMLGEDLVRRFVLDDPVTAAAKAKAKQKERDAHGGHGGGGAAHGEEGHGDGAHGEAAHADAEHGDEGHGDKPHGDDAHGDDAHGEAEHGEEAHGGH